MAIRSVFLLFLVCISLFSTLCFAEDPFVNYEFVVSYITASPLGVPQQLGHCTRWSNPQKASQPSHPSFGRCCRLAYPESERSHLRFSNHRRPLRTEPLIALCSAFQLISKHKMIDRYAIAFFMVLSCLVGVFDASAGDADPLYRVCILRCEKTGCVGEICFPDCKFPEDGASLDGHCQSDCRYYCMQNSEKERAVLGLGPVKYHGKWPFTRVYGIQEPVSVALSALNLAMHFQGWLSFFILLYYKLPLKPDQKPYYEYTILWHIYGLLAMNSWFWSAVFHSRDVDLTEKLDYSSAVALLGCSLILAILRSFSVTVEAARVMVAAPLLAFVITHILYLNNYKLDYGWNMKVCVVMAAAQLLIWAIWAGVTRHPSRWKLWVVVVGGGLAMLLEIYDFPPYQGFVDAHALWHASTIPLTYIWWSFIRDDVDFRTSSLVNKAK